MFKNAKGLTLSYNEWFLFMLGSPDFDEDIFKEFAIPLLYEHQDEEIDDELEEIPF